MFATATTPRAMTSLIANRCHRADAIVVCSSMFNFVWPPLTPRLCQTLTQRTTIFLAVEGCLPGSGRVGEGAWDWVDQLSTSKTRVSGRTPSCSSHQRPPGTP
jgi:hypothetical protein